VIGQTATLTGAKDLVRDLRPDVLLLDLNLADGSSLAGIDALAAETRVVVLTMDASSDKAREALRRGASAYVLKDAADEDLQPAIRAALSGQTYLSPSLGLIGV
jgi:two-component system response regulator NreC